MSENFEAPDTKVEIQAEPQPPERVGDDEHCALLQPGDIDDRDPAFREEVPALLSGWPPRRSK